MNDWVVVLLSDELDVLMANNEGQEMIVDTVSLIAQIEELNKACRNMADYLHLKDWHKLNEFERQMVTKLESLGFLEKKKVADGFVGRSI